jgi:hypothetical protein
MALILNIRVPTSTAAINRKYKQYKYFSLVSIILKWIFRKQGGRMMWIGLICLRIGIGCSEHGGNKPSGSIAGGEFRDQLSDCQQHGFIMMSASYLKTEESRAKSQYIADRGLFDVVNSPFRGNFHSLGYTRLS